MDIKFKKLTKDAKIPQYALDGDIGLDVYCTSVEYDAEHDQYIYHTGLTCESETETAVFGLCRSSNCKTDAYLTNGVGLIDSATYRGEIQFRYKNRDSLTTKITQCAIIDHLNNCTGGMPFCAYYLKIEKEFVEHALDFAPYKVGERVGQFVPMRVEKANPIEVNTLSPSIRGEGGFGHTGK